ncbi:hypothetical protein [Sulfitobacter sp. R18_1]|uniref:hypothetical protein n=1 Tax=Sulfitobacter sp. R18_1 TaxID=2821104 RepID=UPI001ADA9DFA|nr:hypothetical protein [Sulfitobacter sp. R18_1]MBO9428330.1 hypothetical protein [Sulfitobacter sp. R18_1]
METLSLGNPIPERWRGKFPSEGGGILAFSEHDFHISIGFPLLSRKEVVAGREGKIRAGLLPQKDALIMLADIGGAIVVDTSFDPSKVHPDDRGMPSRKEDEGFAVSFALFDTAQDMTMALRFASVTPQFSSLLENMISDLYTRLKEDPRFDGEKSVREAYEKYPSPADMWKDCVAIEYLGQKFRKDDPAPASPAL